MKGNADQALAAVGERPGPSQDHSHTGTVRNAPVQQPVDLTLLPTRRRPASACDESPLAEPRVLG